MPEIESKHLVASPAQARWEVPIRDITAGNVTFHQRKPVNVTVTWEGDAWSFELRELSLLSFGNSSDSARESFSEDFHAMWDVIGTASDDRLTREALLVKKRLQELVESVVGA
jgi:hypothetical protein